MNTYKFFPPERTEFLSNRGVRFTQPSDLNDPSELLPTFVKSDVTNYIQDLKKRGKFPIGTPEIETAFIEFLNSDPSIVRNVVLRVHKEGIDKVGVLSLSKDYSSSAMWAHYCKNYTGYVIEFDARHSFFQRDTLSPPLLSKLTDVTYTSIRPPVTVSNADPTPEMWTTKNPDWAYEKEQRMIRLRADCEISKDEGRISIWIVPPEAIVSIMIGHRSEASLKKEVACFLASHSHVNLFESDPELEIGRVSKRSRTVEDL